MGNEQSTSHVVDEERRVLESLYQISEGRLDNEDVEHVNSKVNAGTSAPNCQPSHTLRELRELEERKREEEARRRREEEEAERLAGLMGVDDSRHREYVEAQLEQQRRDGERLDLSNGDDAQRARQMAAQQARQEPQQGSIGSYVQMAKTGYQELVNAIIR